MRYSTSHNLSLRQFLSRFHSDCSGATSTEYMLILALVVLPIGLLLPLFLTMARQYSARVMSIMPLPFP